MVASPSRRLAAIALAGPLLIACQPTGGHVAAVATGHFTAGHSFPVLLISWCGEEPPRQIDLVGEHQRRHLIATREFEGGSIEVDLSAPGEDWDILDGDGRAVYRLGPDSPQEEYLLGVGTAAAEPGEEAEHDIGTLVFSTGALTSEQGVYASVSGTGKAEFTDAEEFPPSC